MRNLYLFFVLFLTGAFSVFSQEFNFKFGKEGTTSPYLYQIQYVGNDNNAYYLMGKARTGGFSLKSKAIFFKIDNNMNVKLNKDITLFNKKKTGIPAYAMLYDNDIMMFSILFDKGKSYLYATRYSKANFSKKGESKLLAETDYKNSVLRVVQNFNVSVSPDNSKILAAGISNSKDNTGVKIVVFDHELNTLRDNNYTFSGKINTLVEKSQCVDNKGNAYVILGNVKSMVFSVKYNLQLFYDGENGAGFLNIDSIIGGKLVADMDIKMHNDKLYVTGFYTLEGKGGIKGVFNVVVEPGTNKILSVVTKDLPEDILVTIMGKFEEKKSKFLKGKDKLEADDFLLKDMVFMDDGLYIFGESFKFYYKRTSSGTLTVYEYGDVLVTKISEDNVEWMKVVKKCQRSTDDAGKFSSIFVTKHKGNIYMLYNDKKKKYLAEAEKGKKNKGRCIPIGNTVPVVAKITADGNISYSFIENCKSVYLEPVKCGRVDDTKSFLYCGRGMKTFRPVLMEVK